MPILKRRIAPAVAVIALAFAGAACGSSGGSSKGGSADSFCAQVKSIDNADFGDMDREQATEVFKDLAKNAPAEVKGDLDQLLGALTAIDDIDVTDPEAVAKAAEGFDEEKLEAAQENFQNYVEKECGIDIDG